jgi:hypothetical protein
VKHIKGKNNCIACATQKMLLHKLRNNAASHTWLWKYNIMTFEKKRETWMMKNYYLIFVWEKRSCETLYCFVTDWQRQQKQHSESKVVPRFRILMMMMQNKTCVVVSGMFFVLYGRTLILTKIMWSMAHFIIKDL